MRPVLILVTLLLICAPIFAAKPKPPKPEENERVIAYTAWSPTTLYVAFRVEDPLVVGNQTQPMSQPWLDDAVAFYLDLDPNHGDAIDKNCVRVVVSAAGGATVQRGEKGEWRDDPSWFRMAPNHDLIRLGTKVLGTLNDTTHRAEGYKVQVGLSWASLGVLPPFREHRSDPLPAIGFAMACYSQGEMQSVSCWPQNLSEADLDHPTKWGQLQFVQNFQPMSSKEPLASASLTQGDPVINGEMDSSDWLTSGVQVFRKRWGEATIVEPGRQNVSLLAAWYLLNTPERKDAHQPFEPCGPLVGADSPLYHQQQIRDLKRAGIDAMAVVLPADAAEREAMRRRLLALVNALKEYDHATSTEFQCSTPTVFPVVDFSADDAQASTPVVLDDFFRLVPPQYRTTVTDPEKHLCYPVVLTAPAKGKKPDFAFLTQLGDRLRGKLGMPLGWMLDRAWKTDTSQPGVLAYCNWDTTSGVQTGEGPLLAVMVAPGTDTARTEYTSRREGEVYENGWMRVIGSRPDIVIVRSWNDYAHGSEIAPSRQYGYQYIDSTKLATLKLANHRGFGVRILRHTLPTVLRPGRHYPVELVVKNSSVEKIVTHEGFRVDYRIMHNGQQLTTGIATETIVLMELSSARIRFDLFTGADNSHPFPEGKYELYLDFRRNRIPFITLPLMTKILGTLTIPFTVGKESEPVQLIQTEMPEVIPAGMTAPIDIQLRNLTGSSWRKGKTPFRLRWANSAGEPVAEPKVMALKQTVDPADVVTVHGDLPPAPPAAGWYHLLIDYQEPKGEPREVGNVDVLVTDADLRVQFLSIDLPTTIPDGKKEIEVPVALRNPGLTAWPAKETCITYQWLGWDGQPIPGATGSTALTENVKAGGSTTLRMMVALPAGTGIYRCAFGLARGEQTAVFQTSIATMTMPVVQTGLRPEKYYTVELREDDYNDAAATSDTIVNRADVDGRGNAFPLEEFLPDATNPPLGYKPQFIPQSSTATSVGFHFALPRQGKAPMIRAAGQTIGLPEIAAAALHFVAFNTDYVNPVALTVRYTDNTEQTLSVKISNWMDDPAYGEPIMLKTRYLRTPKGDDWYLQGSAFAYRLPLDPAKTVKAIVLPKMSQVCLLAITLELPEKPTEKK